MKEMKMKPLAEAQFWNQAVQSSRSLHGSARCLPNQPPPLDIVSASRLARSQQLLLMQRLLPLPFVPAIVPYSGDCDDGDGECGGEISRNGAENGRISGNRCGNGRLVLDRAIVSTGGRNWWTAITGRMRPQRLFSSQHTEPSGSDTSISRRPKIWSQAKRLLDCSLYALCGQAKLIFGPHTTLVASGELDSLVYTADGAFKTPWRMHSIVRHKLKSHDIVLEAASHERFLDRNGRYWNVPHTLSLDLVSSNEKSGFQYRLGVHHYRGLNAAQIQHSDAPSSSLQLGSFAQAALSLERHVDIWKQHGLHHKMRKPYNMLAVRPSINISGIVGGIINADLRWKGATQQPISSDNNTSRSSSPFIADVFASLGITVQLGLFQRPLLDYTKFSARVDLGSASAFLASTGHIPGAPCDSKNGRSDLPILVACLQQQIIGPIRARAESRWTFNPTSSAATLPSFEEITYGLDCSLESSGAAKLVVWYSPTRKEGMVELRVLER